jgi:hypothetical protein
MIGLDLLGATDNVAGGGGGHGGGHHGGGRGGRGFRGGGGPWGWGGPWAAYDDFYDGPSCDDILDPVEREKCRMRVRNALAVSAMMGGVDVFVARPAVGAEIPAAGAVYTDGGTVLAVQKALLARGFKLPKFGADGQWGGETATAIRQMQASIGAPQSGVIDAGVIMALQVTPAAAPELPAAGRPAKGWSQPAPEKMGPAITPESPGAADEEVATKKKRTIFVVVAGAVVVAVGAVLLASGKRKR